MDTQLFATVNGMAGHQPALDRVMIVLATITPLVMIAALPALWFTGRQGLRRGVLTAAGAALAAVILAEIIGIVYHRRRPYQSPHMVDHLLVHGAHGSSFPSEHVTFGLAIAVGMWRGSPAAGAALLALALLMLFARVYVGAHYPSDVFAGMILGGLCGAAAGRGRPQRLISSILDRRKTQQP